MIREQTVTWLLCGGLLTFAEKFSLHDPFEGISATLC